MPAYHPAADDLVQLGSPGGNTEDLLLAPAQLALCGRERRGADCTPTARHKV